MSDDEAPRQNVDDDDDDDALDGTKFKGFFQPCFMQKQGSLAPTWTKRYFVFNVKRGCLIYYDGKDGPEKGRFLMAKETQVMPSTVAPKKDEVNRAFLVRTDKKILYLVAETPQARDLKMKELSLTLMHLFGEKKPETTYKPAAAEVVLSEEKQMEAKSKSLFEKKDATSQIAKAKASNSSELDLSSCELREFPTRQIQELSSVRTLIVANNKLTKVPDVGRMPNIEELDMSGNMVTAMEAHLFEGAVNMTSLNASSNMLWSVPSELTKLSLLQKLDLRKNKLNSLPEAMDRFGKLEELYLGGNTTLKTLPKSILNITSLEVLDLSRCSLTVLPPQLTQLTRLLDLNLAGNDIKDIPNLSTMTRLSVLDLSTNNVEQVPLTLGKCGLGKLVLSGNPLKDEDLKKEIANGDAAVIAYIKLKLHLEESKRELLPKPDAVKVKKPFAYTPATAKHHVGEMVLKLDELRRNLMLAPSLQEAVPIAQHVRAIKPEIERLRPTLTVEVTPAPVIYATDEKLVALQKTAGAALRDIKNVMSAWHGVLDKVPPPPSEEFNTMAVQVAFCRNALGFKDEAP